MTLETATYIADLQITNPTSTDPVNQGDDHLRLIKQVLQNTFTGATRAFQIPGVKIITTNTTLARTDGESVVYCSTGAGAVNITLPSLVAGDAGWRVHVLKTSTDTNPMFILPPSGTLSSGAISGLSQARRCIPGVLIHTLWTGTAWFVSRVSGAPVGSIIDYYGSSLPAGFEWPDGATLSSAANYPEYNAAMGGLGKPDIRGRTTVMLSQGLGTGLYPAGWMGVALGNTGGTETFALTAGYQASMSVSGSASVSGTVTVYPAGNSGYYAPLSTSSWVTFPAQSPGGSQCANTGGSMTYTNSWSGSNSMSGSISGTASGSGVAHPNLQPSIVVGKILVVE